LPGTRSLIKATAFIHQDRCISTYFFIVFRLLFFFSLFSLSLLYLFSTTFIPHLSTLSFNMAARGQGSFNGDAGKQAGK
jgi:hypothetical protein